MDTGASEPLELDDATVAIDASTVGPIGVRVRRVTVTGTKDPAAAEAAMERLGGVGLREVCHLGAEFRGPVEEGAYFCATQRDGTTVLDRRATGDQQRAVTYDMTRRELYEVVRTIQGRQAS